MKPPIHRVEETACPFCGKKLDAVSPADREEESAPTSGDPSMCFGCGEWLTIDFSVPGGLRKPTEAEYEEIAGSEVCNALRDAWLSYRHLS